MEEKNRKINVLDFLSFFMKIIYLVLEKKILQKLHKASLVSLVVLAVLVNFNIFVSPADIYILLVKLIYLFSH